LFVSKGDFQPGAYEFHVRSRVRANLPRNPETLAQQQNRKQRFDDLVSGKTSEVERLTAARDAIRATGETAASGLAAGEAELSAAREAANQAIAAQEEQGKRLAAAREGIATTAEAAPVLEKARVEAEAAIAAARAARAKLVELEAARASAQAAADVAATQLAIAERELQAATEVQAQLVQLRDEANRQLDEAQKAHGPRDYEFELISQPIRVVVEDAPIAVAVAAEPVVIAPSAAGSVTVEIERKFGFDGDVELKFLPPQGLAANAPPVRISKDAVSGALEVQCPPQAPLGRHACVMEASLQFNGVPITKHIPFEIVISATPE
jgi:hypothetical protein